MRKFLLVILISFMTSSAALAAPAIFFKDNSNGSRTLLAHKPSAAATTTFHHQALNNEVLDLQIMIPLSQDNQQKLKDLLKGLYDPKSAAFHKFLTPAQFNQQYRPSELDINKIKDYLRTKGFSIGDLSPNGSLLNIRGTVQTVNNTFGVNINYYKKNDGTMFYAPNTDPTISSDLVGKVTAIGGLDNLARFKPRVHQSSVSKITMTAAQTKTSNSIGTGPGGYLAPSDVKKAYNLDTIPTINDPNSLQNITLFELDGYRLSDICAFESYFSLPTNECSQNTTIIQNIPIDHFNQDPVNPNGAGEVTIDIEEVIGIAFSSIKKIFVYEALNSLSGWEHEWTAIATENRAKIISCSWGESELSSPTTTFDNNIFSQMAAQGQEVFVASGDNGANTYPSNNFSTNLSVSEPANQPFITSVGITKATLKSDESYNTESGSKFGGGGVSTVFGIPTYQQAMAQTSVATGVSQTMRNIPDVSLTADPATLYSFYFTDFGPGSQGSGFYGFWGSSIAAPAWAAFLLQAYQARAHAGKSNLGFINPVLYQIAGTVNYSNDFHDITTGSNYLISQNVDSNGTPLTTTSPSYPTGAVYPAGTGLDNVTGLGSFKGKNLYTDLLNMNLVAPSAPTGLNATAGNASVALTWNPSTDASSYNIKRSTTNGSGYVTVASSISSTTFTDNSTTDPNNLLTNGTPYFYVISAVNSAGESNISNQASATPVLPPPGTPTNLIAQASNNVVRLTWNASADAASYKIYRKTNINASFTFLNTSGSSTNFTDNTAINGTTYYYVVTAWNTAGESSNSNQVFATPMNVAAPTNFIASLSSWFLGNQVIQLTWNQSTSPNIIQNRIYYTEGSSTTYIALPVLSAINSVQYLQCKKNTIYHFKITAINSNNTESPDSNITTVTTTEFPITITSNQIWR